MDKLIDFIQYFLKYYDSRKQKIPTLTFKISSIDRYINIIILFILPQNENQQKYFSEELQGKSNRIRHKENASNLNIKQKKKIDKDRADFKSYNDNDIIYVKINIRTGNKLTPRHHNKILTQS